VLDAGRNAHERPGAELQRVLSEPHRQRAIEDVEYVMQALVDAAAGPGNPPSIVVSDRKKEPSLQTR
jgi:hypothetical protein